MPASGDQAALGARSSTPRPALLGARIALLGDGEPEVAALEVALTEEGASVERITDADAPRAGEFDAVIVRVECPGTGAAAPGMASRRAELVQNLAHEQRVLALLDEAAGPALGSGCEFALPPFRPAEVIPRVVRLLRTPRPSPTVRFGSLELNAARRTASSGGVPLELTFNEFEVLSVLMAARGGAVARDELHRRLGGEEAATRGRRVDIHIHRLRGKLRASSAVTVDTVRNVGYRLSFAKPGS